MEKKDTDSCFDVTMEISDYLQVCELVGIYLLVLLKNITCKNNFGLCRSDGLFFLGNVNGQKKKKKKKKIKKKKKKKKIIIIKKKRTVSTIVR